MYSSVFVGGTFDGMHRGHQTLLTRAFGEGQQVVIGLTSDTYVQRYKNGKYTPYNGRKDFLGAWLASQGYEGRATIVPIDDPYEPAASSTDYNALIITEHNRTRGEEINSRRFEKGLTPLALIEVPLIVADDGVPISSTRIHQGEIDVAGHLVMPEALRTALQMPLGMVMSDSELPGSAEAHHGDIIVSVGDMTTKTLLATAGIVPALSIIDLQVGRKPFCSLEDYPFPSDIKIIRVKSGPGHISSEAHSSIKNWWSSAGAHVAKPTVLVVDGEEDLLTLPAIAYGREGAVIYYGQPKTVSDGTEGVVEVVVTTEKKSEVSKLLDQFEKKESESAPSGS